MTDEHEDDLYERGLTFDLATARAGVSRRRALGLFGLGAVALAGCAKGAGTATSGTTAGTSATTATTAASGGSRPAGGPPTGGPGGAVASTPEGAIPEETAGPYPGDGSNGPNALVQDGVVRSDITSSFAGATGVATGVPLAIELTVTDRTSGAAKPGAAVYVWHADQQGRYSMYSSGAEDENYLRGVQEAGADGKVRFTSIYPACYDGRWPHVHFEVYPSLADAASAGDPVATSQLAMPDATNTAVFATSGYEQSVSNYARVSLSTDMVFSDGADQETPAMTGDVSSGFTAALTVPV